MVWERDSVSVANGDKLLYKAPNEKRTANMESFRSYQKPATEMVKAKIVKPDNAYPALLAYVPSGIKGLAIAALFAAIVAALSSMINSISTIFTMDIYKEYFNKGASERKLVAVGHTVAVVALLIAIPVAMLLQSVEQVFQVIQEFTGFISPGVLAIFLAGFFWKRTTANAALWAAIITIPLALVFKFAWPSLPFMNRMGIVSLILSAVIILISVFESKVDSPKAIQLDKGLFNTSFKFNIASLGIIIILAILYTIFW
jgi:solute:Na+ symporter, SSS family